MLRALSRFVFLEGLGGRSDLKKEVGGEREAIFDALGTREVRSVEPHLLARGLAIPHRRSSEALGVGHGYFCICVVVFTR